MNLLRSSSNRSLGILEQARFIDELLGNGLIHGYETVPHIPDPRELPQLIPENPAVKRRMRHWALVDSLSN